MAHDDAVTMKMADLFDPEPHTWGLRGDPYLWRALRGRYGHGGMSSGMISLDTWRHGLMPMLAERARRVLDARSS